ncbi:MAG TPA: Tex family protein [Methanospirillum sp.]|nr:Tex family protein [Methanospirillum sp.]
MSELADVLGTSTVQTVRISEQIASMLHIPVHRAAVCIDLLDGGATVPFIARYRKEATGSLDDAVIFSLAGHLERIRRVEERRLFITSRIQEAGHLTADLAVQITAATTLAELEDLYLPYKPRRKTRADKAREQGLEPLAELILRQDTNIDLHTEGARYISANSGIVSAEAAISGAEDIIAGQISEDPSIRQAVRGLYHRSSQVTASAARGKAGDSGKYQEYVGTGASAASLPSHRILALFRGEDEGFLSVKIGPDMDQAVRLITDQYVKGTGPASACVADAAADGYHRLIAPSLERELRGELKERADLEAAAVFGANLRALLLSAPLGPKRILAIDPGFRTGCKMVVLDTGGQPLTTATIFPHDPRPDPMGSERIIRELCGAHQINVIAVGDGTAGRETWQFIRNLHLPGDVLVLSVPEQGASIYSASELAREELPDMDVTMRGAVSIGRRLLDPLAELVKIDPKSLGIGQYQHDIDPAMLKSRLDEVVISAVNQVGIDLNTASPSLLSYVSGLSARTAAAIVEYRDKNGPFTSRSQLKKVKGIGERAFEQAAGFLRIRDGDNPLDGTGVHPERYSLLAEMAASIGSTPADLIGVESLVRQIRLESFVSDRCGLPTLHDISEDLIRPGRDPRGRFEPPVYDELITSFDDLTEGIDLEGVVTNVTKFGAFINIGLSESGLVHVSEMADRFVHDPAEIVKIHQRVRVRVIGIDRERLRISLSIKQADQ